MKGVLDDEDRQSSDATKLYYNSGFASISITDPRKQSAKAISQLSKRFALADARVTATPPLGSTLADLGSAGSSHLRRRPPKAQRSCRTKGGHSHTERSTKDLYSASISQPTRCYPPVRCQDHHRARRSFRRPIVLAWQAAAAAQADFVKTSDGSP